MKGGGGGRTMKLHGSAARAFTAAFTAALTRPAIPLAARYPCTEPSSSRSFAATPIASPSPRCRPAPSLPSPGALSGAARL